VSEADIQSASFEHFHRLAEEPRALPIHVTDYRSSFSNPESIITVRVRGHLSDDGWGIGGRLVEAIDENGNPYSIVGLSPGSVRACPSCKRRVYLPDSAADKVWLPCPFGNCDARLSLRPMFGDERVEDAPATVESAGTCSEHGTGCPGFRELDR
jgi:hypothetical protein